MFFTHKRFDDPYSRHALADHIVKVVVFAHQFGKYTHGAAHYEIQGHGQENHSGNEYQAQAQVDEKAHEHAGKHIERGAHADAQKHLESILDIGHVGGHTRHKARRAERVYVGK